MKYLTVKEGAKILHNLYANYLNRLGFKEAFVPMELTKKQKEKFCQYAITDEEKWAYANGMIEVSEETDFMSEGKHFFPKKQFLKVTVEPLVKVFTPRGKQYTVETFILDNHFLDDAINQVTDWLCKDGKITIEDAKKIVSKVIAFLED